MNLLGHLYLSEQADFEVRLFNLLGDRFKGNAFEGLSEKAIRGVRLHREIDHFIDTHPVVLVLKKRLSVELPKVSGIAIDVYFDHLLARHWNFYHELTLDEFIDVFFDDADKNAMLIPKDYVDFIHRLRKERYIHRYGEEESIEAIGQFLHHKLKSRTEIHCALRIFYTFEAQIRISFEKFIVDAQQNFRITGHQW